MIKPEDREQFQFYLKEAHTMLARLSRENMFAPIDSRNDMVQTVLTDMLNALDLVADALPDPEPADEFD